MSRWLSRLLIAFVAAVIAAGLWRHYQPPDLELAFPAGEIVIGVDGSFPPFALDEGGGLAGLDIELAEALGAEIGLPVRFVNIGYYALYDALISGRVDMLAAGLRIDPARMAAIHYSQPYFDNGWVLAWAADERLDAGDLDGVAVAYEYASGADSLVRAWTAAGRAITQMPYELPAYALDAVRLGQAQAALVDLITLRQYARRHESWQYQQRRLTSQPYAIALRKDRVDAAKLLERAMCALKERGELARLLRAWL